MLQAIVVYGSFTARREVNIPTGCHSNRTVIAVDIGCPRVYILTCLDRNAAFSLHRCPDFHLPLCPQIVILVEGHILTSIQCL